MSDASVVTKKRKDHSKFVRDIGRILRWRRRYLPCATCAHAEWGQDSPQKHELLKYEYFDLRGLAWCLWQPEGWPQWAWAKALHNREGYGQSVSRHTVRPWEEMKRVNGRFYCPAHKPRTED